MAWRCRREPSVYSGREPHQRAREDHTGGIHLEEATAGLDGRRLVRPVNGTGKPNSLESDAKGETDGLRWRAPAGSQGGGSRRGGCCLTRTAKGKRRGGLASERGRTRLSPRRFLTSGCTFCAGPEPLPPKGLHCLVLLCHAHSRECNLAPELRGPAGRGGLVWECAAGHTFSWEPPLNPAPAGATKQARRSGQEPAGLQRKHEEGTVDAGLPRGVGPPPEPFPAPGEEEDEDEEEMLSDASPWTYSSSPDEQVGSELDVPRLPTPPATRTPEEGETPVVSGAVPIPAADPCPSASLLGPGPLTSEAEVQLELTGDPQAEPLASPRSQALAGDEDTAQIGPKRIRRAAKRELMPCDFPGCGRIFSNRQYLNHHKKYQHILQKSFCCPEPACGKSFNFKKHLKEHVKLHSDTRDYICEFCARTFRTSSNLVIHRRIHTGEKPLQCEICGFTCRQKASLNWHRRKHAETAAALRFPCEFCGKRFEKPDSVAAHRTKSHPALLPAPQREPSAASASEAQGSSQGATPPPPPQGPAPLSAQ
ncbi:zinc finger protein 692 [Fukomys damarensis]|uniref:zinc finger protein 692 n=1 Tax=Fukomys damarensis TaxID=885580 RepID=UPI00053FE8E9|nr:zinc finger protein 692 [Fukomys damarensis]